MRKAFIVFWGICIFLSSCNFLQNSSEKNAGPDIERQDSVMSPIIKREVDKLIDSLRFTEYKDWPVIHIYFAPSRRVKPDDEYLSIASTLSYMEVGRKGYYYFLYRNKIVGVSSMKDSKYIQFFIDTTKLRYNPDGFGEGHGYYEPYQRLFKVLSRDSLQLVYEGY